MNLETELSADLWRAVRTRWENRDYTGAILDGVHFLSDLIREKGDLEADGVPLVGQAFGGSTPRIKITRLHTESDRNIQAGVESMLRGLYQAIRNPRSHGAIKDTEQDAGQILVFMDYIVRLIGQARSIFSKQEFLDRVFEEDFVRHARYVELLVEEIPRKELFPVALEIFRKRAQGNGENLALLTSQLLPSL